MQVPRLLTVSVVVLLIVQIADTACPPSSEPLPGRPSFQPIPLVAGLPATLNFSTFPEYNTTYRISRAQLAVSKSAPFGFSLPLDLCLLGLGLCSNTIRGSRLQPSPVPFLLPNFAPQGVYSLQLTMDLTAVNGRQTRTLCSIFNATVTSKTGQPLPSPQPGAATPSPTPTPTPTPPAPPVTAVSAIIWNLTASPTPTTSSFPVATASPSSPSSTQSATPLPTPPTPLPSATPPSEPASVSFPTEPPSPTTTPALTPEATPLADPPITPPAEPLLTPATPETTPPTSSLASPPLPLPSATPAADNPPATPLSSPVTPPPQKAALAPAPSSSSLSSPLLPLSTPLPTTAGVAAESPLPLAMVSPASTLAPSSNPPAAPLTPSSAPPAAPLAPSSTPPAAPLGSTPTPPDSGPAAAAPEAVPEAAAAPESTTPEAGSSISREAPTSLLPASPTTPPTTPLTPSATPIPASPSTEQPALGAAPAVAPAALPPSASASASTSASAASPSASTSSPASVLTSAPASAPAAAEAPAESPTEPEEEDVQAFIPDAPLASCASTLIQRFPFTYQANNQSTGDQPCICDSYSYSANTPDQDSNADSTQGLQDDAPSNSYVTRISFSLFGVSCNRGDMAVHLNGVQIGLLPATDFDCACGAQCVTKSFTSDFTGLQSPYLTGQINNVTIVDDPDYSLFTNGTMQVQTCSS